LRHFYQNNEKSQENTKLLLLDSVDFDIIRFCLRLQTQMASILGVGRVQVAEAANILRGSDSIRNLKF
jgi:hypothetical protein